MIEIAKSGAEVLLVSGLATASLVNPEREGKQWADAQIERLKVARLAEPIVVLGAGSGFHIRALQLIQQERSMPRRIIVLDTCGASIAFCRERIEGIEFFEANLSAGVDAFVSGPQVVPWITQAFTYLKHKPTVMRSGTDLRILESWILARTPEAFSAQLKLRPQIAAALDPARAGKIASCPLISIRDLSKIWDISSELKTDRRIFRVLEELVR